MAKVTISIVSYSQRALLDRCLAQLRKIGLPTNWCTIVVDNNSTDGSAEMVEERHSWVELVRLPENLGFGGGHNTAYKRTDSTFFFVLNPDVIVLPGSLEELVKKLEELTNAAVVGPRLLNPDGTIQFSARHYYDWWTVACRRLPLPGGRKVRDYHLMKEWDHADMRSVDWMLGAAMGLRRAAFAREELFDRRYKLYFEDVDLCYFARKQGWDVLYCPTSQMIHDHQRTSAKGLSVGAKLTHFMSWQKFWLKGKGWFEPEQTTVRKAAVSE